MVQIIRSLTAAVVASLAISCLAAAPASDIATNIGNLIETGKQVEASFKTMNGANWMFISPSIHSGLQTLTSGIDQCSRDVAALGTPASPADALSILNAMTPLVTLSQMFSNTLITAKPALVAFPVVGPIAMGLINMELAMFERSATGFANVMISMAPASLASNASDMRTSIMNTLEAAIQAYATN